MLPSKQSTSTQQRKQVLKRAFTSPVRDYASSADCKSESDSELPSPSPSLMMSDLDFEHTAHLKYKKYRDGHHIAAKMNLCGRSTKKRRHPSHCKDSEQSLSCLRKVTLSDGSVCYTMASAQPITQPPAKKRRANSLGTALIAIATKSASEPPKKRRKSMSTAMSTQNNIDAKKIDFSIDRKKSKTTVDTQNTTSTTKPKTKLTYTVQRAKHRKPGLPVETKVLKATTTKGNDEHEKEKAKEKKKVQSARSKSKTSRKSKKAKKKLRRRHTVGADWTSKSNLMASLQRQRSLENELFGSDSVPTVNLEEMFNGQEYIRVHKHIRPINLRRETQIFGKI